MAMNPRKVGEGLYQPVAEINVTPLVDVMLVLLIIFMVTAPMLATGIKVNLPSAKTAQPLENKEPVIVIVAKDGSLSVGKDPVSRGRAGGEGQGRAWRFQWRRSVARRSRRALRRRRVGDGRTRGERNLRASPSCPALAAPCRRLGPRQTLRRPARLSPPRRTRRRRDRSQLWTGGSSSRRPLRPPWLRPLVIPIVIALHAAALSFVYLDPEDARTAGRNDRRHSAGGSACGKSAAPPAEQPKPPEQSAPPPAQDAAPAPAEPQPPIPLPRRSPSSLRPRLWRSNLRFPRRRLLQPPVAEQPPPPPVEQPATSASAETPPPPPAPVELAPPPPPPPKPVEAPRPKPPPLRASKRRNPSRSQRPASTSGSDAISVRGSRSSLPQRFLDERARERGGERFLAFGLYRGGELRHS